MELSSHVSGGIDPARERVGSGDETTLVPQSRQTLYGVRSEPGYETICSFFMLWLKVFPSTVLSFEPRAHDLGMRLLGGLGTRPYAASLCYG